MPLRQIASRAATGAIVGYRAFSALPERSVLVPFDRVAHHPSSLLNSGRTSPLSSASGMTTG